MAAIRRAEVVWKGDLLSGKGQVSAGTSGLFQHLPVTWAARTEKLAQGKTSPEELVAAAHASCFAMALSGELARAGFVPQQLDVTASVTFDQVDGAFRVVSSVLEVRGRVSGLDAGRFASLAETAKENCPVSKALKGNVALEVRAQLVESVVEESAPV